MATSCQATTKAGQPCSAQARPGRPFCLWHDPNADEERRRISAKGGHQRSNVARARKVLATDVLDTEGVQGVVCKTMQGVLDGTVDPPMGNAVANLARVALAAIDQRAMTELAERLTEIENRAAS